MNSSNKKNNKNSIKEKSIDKFENLKSSFFLQKTFDNLEKINFFKL